MLFEWLILFISIHTSLQRPIAHAGLHGYYGNVRMRSCLIPTSWVPTVCESSGGMGGRNRFREDTQDALRKLHINYVEAKHIVTVVLIKHTGCLIELVEEKPSKNKKVLVTKRKLV